jgi:hypothetical protein
VEDAVERYRIASEANDIDGIMSVLTPDVEVVSPISAHMVFRGQDDVRVLLAAVYGTLKDLRWYDGTRDRERQVLIADAKVGPLTMTDAMVFDLAEDGRIKRMRPHLRPWLALTLFAMLLAPKVGRRPGVVRRALRRA